MSPITYYTIINYYYVYGMALDINIIETRLYNMYANSKLYIIIKHIYSYNYIITCSYDYCETSMVDVYRDKTVQYANSKLNNIIKHISSYNYIITYI